MPDPPASSRVLQQYGPSAAAFSLSAKASSPSILVAPGSEVSCSEGVSSGHVPVRTGSEFPTLRPLSSSPFLHGEERRHLFPGRLSDSSWEFQSWLSDRPFFGAQGSSRSLEVSSTSQSPKLPRFHSSLLAWGLELSVWLCLPLGFSRQLLSARL